MKDLIKTPDSRFLRVQCLKCNSKQIIFGNAASTINCSNCGKVLAEPTGGKSKIKTKVLEVLE